MATKGAIESKLLANAITPQQAASELLNGARAVAADIRGVGAYLQSRTFKQVLPDGTVLQPLDLQTSGNPFGQTTIANARTSIEYRLAHDYGVNISATSNLYELFPGMDAAAAEAQLTARQQFLQRVATALDSGPASVERLIAENQGIFSDESLAVRRVRAAISASELGDPKLWGGESARKSAKCNQ